VQAICDFVHGHITFSYPDADPLRTAYDGFVGRKWHGGGGIGQVREFQ